MLDTIIIDNKDSETDDLAIHLKMYCPFLNYQGVICEQKKINIALKNPNLHILFVNPSIISNDTKFHLETEYFQQKSIICINESFKYAELAINWKSVSYLKKPFCLDKLMKSLAQAKLKIKSFDTPQLDALNTQSLTNKSKQNHLFGIPSIKGYEIIDIRDIIRCEGLQKCTKVVAKNRENIISSYSIGVFKKKLSQYSNFFSPHRSYIVNLQYVKSYQKCGVVIMKDNHSVPISQGNKKKILDRILHI